MLHPRLKLTNELRGVNTDRVGRRKTDLEELKLKTIFMTDGMSLGIKVKYAVGVEWLKDLGRSDRGTGTGANLIAPLLGIGWVPTEMDFIITLAQYFHSCDTDTSTRSVRRTGPRLIWIRKLPTLRASALLRRSSPPALRPARRDPLRFAARPHPSWAAGPPDRFRLLDSGPGRRARSGS